MKSELGAGREVLPALILLVDGGTWKIIILKSLFS